MKKQCEPKDWEYIKNKIAGLGERSFRKSYYPELQKAEHFKEALRLSSFTVETSADAVFWITPDGSFYDVNKAACDELGYSKDELKSLHVWDIDPLYTMEKWPETWREQKLKGRVKFETIHKTRTGKLIPVEILGSYLRYDDAEYACAFSRDITDRKMAEDALRESEEKFRALSETSTAAILVYQGMRLVSVNQAAVWLSGYSKDELLRMNFLDIVHPEFRDLIYKYSLARQRNEPVPNRYEFKVVTKGGDEMWIEISVGRIVYKGQPAGVATLFDITDRKQAEQALADAKTQIELYLDLMSHDINNLNQSAAGYLELVQQMLEEGKQIGAGEKNLIEKPLKALNSSSALIRNVRQLQSLMTEGIKTMPIDLSELIKKLDVQSMIPGGRQVTINLEPVPHYKVEANELLKDVFVNLITNAIKHSCADIPLTVNVRVEKIMENNLAYYRCIVEDDGQGIPDDLKEKLFQRFQRGKTKARGKGLGLYLVKTLVEGYGGKVWVEDRIHGKYREGARFVVQLLAVDE